VEKVLLLIIIAAGAGAVLPIYTPYKRPEVAVLVLPDMILLLIVSDVGFAALL